jgi:hypothetical protein
MKTGNLANYCQTEKKLSPLSSNYYKKQLVLLLFNMKNTNFSSRVPKQIKSKNEETHNLEKGITKVLLDKYKPKILYDIENLNERKDQRRVA